ncbi:MAG: HAMP domain-containing protein [Chloroflexi bacterium]|nr:HAMP domain-containing protein [Chloroflexota bacterium]
MNDRSTETETSLVKRILEFSASIGLSTKIGILVVIGTFSMIGLFAYLGTAALSDNTQRNLQERVVLAQMSASYVDALLDHIENVLTYTASEDYWSDTARANVYLDQAYQRLNFVASHVFLVDTKGHVLASKPESNAKISFGDFPPVMTALNGTPFSVAHVAQSANGQPPFIVAASPIRNASNKVSGALVIALNFSGAKIRAFTHPIGLGESGYMDLVDLSGRILASTREGRVDGDSDHGFSLMGMIRDHRPSVSACHDCHTQSTANAGPRAEVLAFAPLERAQWGMTVRQSEEEVFSSTRTLQMRIFALLVVMLVGALAMAYLTTRSVIRPVQALTAATRRITAGDLNSPLKTFGHDEVGVLARAFDEMRVRLRHSHEEIQAWNRELDARVQERTAAYEAAARENRRLYAELQHKEHLRGELLHRVISAQEDERKRIARELHDETSQGLSALMVGMDTIPMALAQDAQKANVYLKRTKSIAEGLLKNIHRIIADLRPTLLDDLGLVPAIGWYGEQRLEPLGIQVCIEEVGQPARLPPVVETSFFRIAQEALTNIARHAQATRVRVRVKHERGWVTLTICDNGRGFDPSNLDVSNSPGLGLGLRGMQERAEILGGTFELQTTPGEGTLIFVRVPAPMEEAIHVENSRADGG